MAGLLAHLVFFEAFPTNKSVSGSRISKKTIIRLTAAGTAPDLNRIPILRILLKRNNPPFRCKNRIINGIFFIAY